MEVLSAREGASYLEIGAVLGTSKVRNWGPRRRLFLSEVDRGHQPGARRDRPVKQASESFSFGVDRHGNRVTNVVRGPGDRNQCRRAISEVQTIADVDFGVCGVGKTVRRGHPNGFTSTLAHIEIACEEPCKLNDSEK